MGQIQVEKNAGEIEGLCVITPTVHGDDRGYFDLRKGSETYGKWYGLELSEENKKQFYIPKGFAHGYLVLSEWAEFCYKCTDFYHPGDDGGLVWNDPAIGITWPDVTGEYPGNGSSSGYHMSDGTPLNILERDENWPTLANL